MAQRSSESRNDNFGILRLVFALLVIVSHAPELVDGNRSREILTRVFGTLSFGELAVDGFFLLSGYLITRSFAREPRVWTYGLKRIGRIVPGYVVCFALCVFALAPAVGATLDPRSGAGLARALGQMATLSHPQVPGAFADLPAPLLNASLWTIAYEARCYVLVAILGTVGGRLPFGRWLVLAAVVIGLALTTCKLFYGMSVGPFEAIVGQPGNDIRFFSMFGTGALFVLFDDVIVLSRKTAVLAGLVLVGGLSNGLTVEWTTAFAGGALVLWFARKAPAMPLSRLTGRIDLSYGLYLYAWPIQNLLVWHDRTIDPWVMALLSIPLAGLAGLASWTLIERPALHLAHRVANRMPTMPLKAITASI